jgi:class 3 adenylate cyclase
MKVFISYRQTDSEAIAGRIRDRLANRYGDDAIFMDIDNIPFGKDFRQHIQRALAQSSVLVALIGSQWLGADASDRARIHADADPVRIEIELAQQMGITIIPVLIGNATMPAAAQLPDAIKDLSFINAARLDTGRDFHRHMERLIRSVDEILRNKNVLPASTMRMALHKASIGPPRPRETGSNRRLAAVAFVDIVGYSILMAKDETRTLQRWITILSEVIRPQVERCRGTLVKSTGDGVLVEFPSAHDAVEWAREVQRLVISKQVESGNENATIALRAAVHLGDVVTTE